MVSKEFETEYRIQHFYKSAPLCCNTQIFIPTEEEAYKRYLELINDDRVKEVHAYKKNPEGSCLEYKDITEEFEERRRNEFCKSS